MALKNVVRATRGWCIPSHLSKHKSVLLALSVLLLACSLVLGVFLGMGI